MTRDPKRIDRILEQVRQVWTNNPDWRLGQLIVNAVREFKTEQFIFYIEDDQLENGLDLLEERMRKTL